MIVKHTHTRTNGIGDLKMIFDWICTGGLPYSYVVDRITYRLPKL